MTASDDGRAPTGGGARARTGSGACVSLCGHYQQTELGLPEEAALGLLSPDDSY